MDDKVMLWTSETDTYGNRYFYPEGDGSDDRHASGSMSVVKDNKCGICKKTGKCIYFNDHRFGDTDEIDLSICPECVKMGLAISKNNEKK